MLDLPNELLQKIIGYASPDILKLYTLANVSRRFRENSRQVFASKDYQEAHPNKFSLLGSKPLHMVEHFFDLFGTSIGSWSSHFSADPDAVNGIVARHCPNIHTFHGTITEAESAESMRPLSGRVDVLRLRVKHSRCEALELADLIEDCSTVRWMSIAGGCNTISGAAIHMPRLETLHLESIVLNTDFLAFLECNPQLRELRLTSVEMGFYFDDVAAVLPNLRSLKLWSPYTQVDLQDHASLHNLRRLNTLHIAVPDDRLTVIMLATLNRLAAPLRELVIRTQYPDTMHLVHQMRSVKVLRFESIHGGYELGWLADQMVHLQKINIVDAPIDQCTDMVHAAGKSVKQVCVSLLRQDEDDDAEEYMLKLDELKEMADSKNISLKVNYRKYYVSDTLVSSAAL